MYSSDYDCLTKLFFSPASSCEMIDANVNTPHDCD